MRYWTRCAIFFDKQERSYRNAQQNCKLIFGSTGYLFEPISNDQANLVYHLAKPVLGTSYTSDYWIGLDSIGRGATDFRYASNGKPKSQQLTSSDWNNAGFGATMGSSDGVLQDEQINNIYFSICQFTFE